MGSREQVRFAVIGPQGVLRINCTCPHEPRPKMCRPRTSPPTWPTTPIRHGPPSPSLPAERTHRSPLATGHGPPPANSTKRTHRETGKWQRSIYKCFLYSSLQLISPAHHPRIHITNYANIANFGWANHSHMTASAASGVEYIAVQRLVSDKSIRPTERERTVRSSVL